LRSVVVPVMTGYLLSSLSLCWSPAGQAGWWPGPGSPTGTGQASHQASHGNYGTMSTILPIDQTIRDPAMVKDTNNTD